MYIQDTKKRESECPCKPENDEVFDACWLGRVKESEHPQFYEKNKLSINTREELK